MPDAQTEHSVGGEPDQEQDRQLEIIALHNRHVFVALLKKRPEGLSQTQAPLTKVKVVEAHVEQLE